MATSQKTLELKKFNMKMISFNPKESEGPIIVMIGRRGMGKTFLIKDLLYHHQDIPVGTVISGTEAGNGFYAEIVPKLFIHHEYKSEIIDNLLKRQKMMILNMKQEIKNYGNYRTDPRAFLILDDCLHDNKWANDKLMKYIFFNGRHMRIMMIITMQYPLGVPPALRTNIDYVFIMREPYLTNRERIWKNYASMFATFEAFCQIMDATTENYECLVVSNSTKSNKLTDQVFWYKAETRANFRLGGQEYWRISATMADNDEEMYDPNKSKKKARENIAVKKAW